MKKIIISTDALKPVLHKLGLVMLKNPVLPILSNILCKVTAQLLELTGSDQEVTIHQKCVCETSGEDFEFLIPFHLISKIVALNKSCPLVFSIEKKGLKVTADGEVYDIKAAYKTEDYPKLADLPKKTFMQLDSKVIGWLNTALETASKDEVNKARFTKVLLELRQNEITIASTDGSYYLFQYTLPMAAPADDELLISAKVIKALDGIDEPKLYWRANNFTFVSEDITVSVTRSELKYVNFRAIIPADFATNLKVDKHNLVNALEKCSINTDPFKDTTIDLAKKKKDSKAVFYTRDETYGIDINVDVPIEYEGKVEAVHVHSDRMLKVINQVDFPSVELAIHDTRNAILFRSADDTAYLGLLMTVLPRNKA